MCKKVFSSKIINLIYIPLGSTFVPYLTGQKVMSSSRISSGSPHEIQFQVPEQTDQSAYKKRETST